MSDAAIARRPLPVGSIGRGGVGWWGALCFIASEAVLFGYLLFGYLYCAITFAGDWLPAKRPDFHFSLPATIVLIASSLAIGWGARGAVRDAHWQVRLGLMVATLCGIAFAALQWADWNGKDFTLRSDAYGSMYFTITGMHLAHLLAGVVALLLVLLWSLLGYFDALRHTAVLVVAAYWHFVVALGVLVFVVLNVTPYLMPPS